MIGVFGHNMNSIFCTKGKWMVKCVYPVFMANAKKCDLMSFEAYMDLNFHVNDCFSSDI